MEGIFKERIMFKFSLMTFAFFFLCAFSEMGNQSFEFNVETKSTSWVVEMRGSSSVRAFHEPSGTELFFNFSDLMPNSPQCLSNKRIKDIKFTLNIYKKIQKGDYDFAKSFEQTRIRFSGNGKSEERKPYGSNLVKNNLRFSEGETVNIGTLQFLSPITCNDFMNMQLYISDMKAGGRSMLPTLDLKIIPADDNNF